MEALKAGGKFSAAAPFVRAAACALSGAVAVLGFAPFNWWLPTLVAFAALFFCIEKSAGVKEAFLDGWFWGLAFFTLGLSWTHRSMAVFGGFGDVLAAAGVFLMAAVLALTAAVPCAAARFFKAPQGLRSLLYLPVCWVLSEIIRTDVFGFGWLTAGYAFLPTPLAGWAPAGGVFLTALAALFAAGLVAAATLGMKGVAVKTAGALLAGVAVAGGFGLEGISWFTPGKTLDVRLVQPDLPIVMRVTASEQTSRLERVKAMSLASPLGGKLDLILWPESVYAALLNRLKTEEALLPARVARAQKTTVLFNAFEEPARGVYFNSLWAADEAGSEAPVYAKRHLVPFGEYVPFGFRWFVDAMGIPMADQRHGLVPEEALKASGIVYAPAVCYENNFGGELRAFWQKREVPQLIVVTANLGWFGDWAAAQFTQISAMRAREFATPLLQVVNNGSSAVIDFRGRLERWAGPGAQSLDALVTVSRGSVTPYARFGDLPLAVLLTLILAVIAFCHLRRKRRESALR